MSVLKVIQAKLDSMTDAERQIGQFIIDDPDRMVQLSSAELAAATGRSQSSVVKFSQKIGYDGYQQLKLAVTKAKAQEWRVPSGMIHGTIDAGDNFVTIQQKLVASKVSAMQQTMQVNAEDAVTQAAGRIAAAIGAGAAIYVCGSIAGMAPGVHAALAEIVGENALEAMLEEGRYRRDIY